MTLTDVSGIEAQQNFYCKARLKFTEPDGLPAVAVRLADRAVGGREIWRIGREHRALGRVA